MDGETKSVGFTGMVKRLVSIKELLDDQVCIVHKPVLWTISIMKYELQL